MRLYEVPRMTRFTLVGDREKVEFLLDHIDGMYSVCFRCIDNALVHLSANSIVELVDS